jgi:hypothetical protein
MISEPSLRIVGISTSQLVWLTVCASSTQQMSQPSRLLMRLTLCFSPSKMNSLPFLVRIDDCVISKCEPIRKAVIWSHRSLCTLSRSAVCSSRQQSTRTVLLTARLNT